MQVTLLAYTQMTYDKPHSPLAQQLVDYVATGEHAFDDALIEYAGRICYNTTDKLGHNVKFIPQRLREGHLTLAEHCSATFLVEDISRSCLQQLVRHGLMTQSVMSSRYVNQDTDKPVSWSKFTNQEYLDMINKYQSGMSAMEISDLYECSPETVLYTIRKNGLTVRRRGEYKCANSNLFNPETITPVEASLLGWLFSDGNLICAAKNNYRISISSKDKQIIDQISAIMSGVIYHRETADLYLAILSSREIFDRLVNVYGCGPNKSLTINGDLLEKSLPEHLLSHFVRGYFEGDGSIGIYKDKSSNKDKFCVSFTSGSQDFLVWLDKIISIKCKTKPKKIKKSSSGYGGISYALTYQGILEIERVLDWMYKDIDCRLCLWRKAKLAAQLSDDAERSIKFACLTECARINIVVPPSITEFIDTLLLYTETCQNSKMAYEQLGRVVLSEDRMMLLPESHMTTLVLSGNFSMYRNLLQQRLAPAAKWEIRALCQDILRDLSNIAPLCFGDLWEQYGIK